jgi:Xaa-Pro aminopeptidase
VPEFLVPGRTEADVAADIAEAIVAEGHSEVAFIIVGSGPHGADPHHECSPRELRAGDIVVVDIGGPYEPGYNSDSTRTYSIGEPSPEVAQRYSVLQRAQRAAVEAVRPGVTAEQVDAVAREVLAEAGFVTTLEPDTAEPQTWDGVERRMGERRASYDRRQKSEGDQRPDRRRRGRRSTD